MKVGQKIYINESVGNVVILDIHEDYLVLFNAERGKFIKANRYYNEGGKLFWKRGEYYWSFDKLIESLS